MKTEPPAAFGGLRGVLGRIFGKMHARSTKQRAWTILGYPEKWLAPATLAHDQPPLILASDFLTHKLHKTFAANHLAAH